VNLTIDLDREEDGRWMADALELPGVMCYGQAAGRIARQELPSSALAVSFTIPDGQLARQ
jgi:hypothetical protein